MKASDTVMPFSQIEAIDLKNAESNFTDALYDVAREQSEISFKSGVKEVVEFINNLIIGIEGCKFEERLDGDKGCIVLDMNENQWQSKLKEWGCQE